MARIRTPKTSKAMRKFSQNSASKKGGVKKKTKALKRLQFIDDSSESEEEQGDSLTDSFELLEIEDVDQDSDSGQDSEEEKEEFFVPDNLSIQKSLNRGSSSDNKSIKAS